MTYGHIQNAQIIDRLNGVNHGLNSLENELASIQQQTASIEVELQAARQHQQTQAFWKETIFTIRKGLEKATQSVDRLPHRALYFAESFRAYMQEQGLSSKMFEQISDKEYWNRTVELRDRVHRQATGQLPKEDIEAVVRFIQFQQIRESLFNLVAWKKAYPSLREWWAEKASLPSANNSKRKRVQLLKRFFEFLGKTSGVIGAIVGGLAAFPIAILIWLVISERGYRLEASVYLVIIAAIAGGFIYLLRYNQRYTAKLQHLLEHIPNPPAAALQLLEPTGWSINLYYTEADWNADASGFASEVSRYGIQVNASESVASLEGLLSDCDDHIEAWQGRLLLS